MAVQSVTVPDIKYAAMCRPQTRPVIGVQNLQHLVSPTRDNRDGGGRGQSGRSTVTYKFGPRVQCSAK